MRVFLSAGEPSGDTYAAALVQELKKTGSEFQYEGVGGKKLAAEIGILAADSTTWAAISIVQSLQIYPRAFRGGKRAQRIMARGYPGLFVAIDFGYFNVRMCRFAKRHGWKVLYFMPPSSWRRDKQGRDLPTITDAVVTPFPWSAEVLKGIGVNAHFFGHPIKQLMGSACPAASREGIAVLPGSRRYEIERHLPLFSQVVDESFPRAEFAVAPNLDVEALRADWKRLAPKRDDIFTQGDVYGVLGRARAALVCSGTATLESALMRCPHVVVYRVTKAMAREAGLIRFQRPKFIALPNIVLDREVVPEFAGLELDASAIRSVLTPLLEDGSERESQVAGFAEIDAILGPRDAITKTAELALDLISK